MPCTYCGSRDHSLSRCPWRQARDAWLGLPDGVRAGAVVLLAILIGLALPL
jgi:hypothetical protein